MHSPNEKTITYGTGRFVIDIPASMQFSGSYSMRTRDLTEMVMPEDNPEIFARRLWDQKIAEIEKIKAPEGKKKALIEVRDIPGTDQWSKAVYFYGDQSDMDRGDLHILVSKRTTGVWIKSWGEITGRDFSFGKSSDLARAYRPPAQRLGTAQIIPGRDSFYLRYGAIDLPFEYKESVDLVFRGHPLDEKLSFEIEINVVQEVEKVGLAERLAAAVATNYAPGVKVEKIKSGKRTVAGLKGEELIMRGSDKGQTALNFQWNYPGKKNDSHHPNITVLMDSQDSQLGRKIALWDALLNAMRPAGR